MCLSIRVANSRLVACITLVTAALLVPCRTSVLSAQQHRPEGTVTQQADDAGVTQRPVLGTLSPIGVVRGTSSSPSLTTSISAAASRHSVEGLYNADDHADLRMDKWRAARITGEVVGVVAVLFAIFVVSRVRAD